MERLGELMERLEGVRFKSYKDTKGLVTVGYGFNMDANRAKQIWDNLDIMEDFDDVYNRDEEISHFTATILLEYFWAKCEKTATNRCRMLDIDYSSLPEWHKFILADIVYNTGSLSNWHRVITETDPERVLLEARRRPHDIMDSRIAKIGYFFGLLASIEEAIKIGLTGTRYIK